MAEDNIDGILVRLGEIEKLQTELRHLVPRVTGGSSRPHAERQDLPRGTPASIRFPSLFTFPVISNFTPAPKNEERVQKSAARSSLDGKSPSGYRRSTVNLRDAGGSSRNGTSATGTNVFKDLLKGSSDNVTSSRARNSSASTSVADSRAPMRYRDGIGSRVAKEPQEAIKRRLKAEASKTAARDKTRRATGERSNMQLSGNENNPIRSSVQTSDIRVRAREATGSRGAASRLGRNRRCDSRSGTLVERIMEKLNYCFLDDERVTVPHHHLGSRTPRRVQMLHSPAIGGTETPRLYTGSQ